eukprot:7897759-Pyramimonas_sp.AAC.1
MPVLNKVEIVHVVESLPPELRHGVAGGDLQPRLAGATTTHLIVRSGAGCACVVWAWLPSWAHEFGT